MWFLLLQIILLLLLAAVLGAALGHWWTRRRYEDVTEIHEELIALRGNRAVPPLTRDDVRGGIAELRGEMVTNAAQLRDEVKSSLADMRGEMVSNAAQTRDKVEANLSDVRTALDGIRIPDMDLSPVHQRVDALEQQLAGVAGMVGRLNNVDLSPIIQRLGGVEGVVREWKAPEVDLGPVHTGIVGLQLAIDELKAGSGATDALQAKLGILENGLLQLGEDLDRARRADADALTARVAALQERVANIRSPELAPALAPLEQKLSALERTIASIRMPEPDLTPIQVALAQVDRGLRALDKPPLDLEPLARRFTGLEAGLGMLQTETQARRALEPVERRLAGLEEALAGRPEPDVQGVITAVLDTRDDLAAVENRITAIEYSLAALHHMMRSRGDGEWRTRTSSTTAATPRNGRPPRESDPINPVRRPDDQANLLAEAAFGPADDLSQINGVGPILASMLNDIGVFYFWQVAEWSPEEVAFVDGQLRHFSGRIKRDDWVGHSKQLMQQPAAAKRPRGV